MVMRSMQIAGCLGFSAHRVFNTREPLVVSIRNPADILASHMRLDACYGRAANQTVRCFGAFFKMLEHHPGAIVWIYELHRQDTAEWIAEVLKCPLSGEDVAAIKDVCNVFKARRIARHVGHKQGWDFKYFDKATYIHARHVGAHNGKPEAWKSLSCDKRDFILATVRPLEHTLSKLPNLPIQYRDGIIVELGD